MQRASCYSFGPPAKCVGMSVRMRCAGCARLGQCSCQACLCTTRLVCRAHEWREVPGAWRLQNQHIPHRHRTCHLRTLDAHTLHLLPVADVALPSTASSPAASAR
eukprot:4099940-Alexandrium_andersonii.AAC.1